MTTINFITELFCRIDDAMTDIRKDSQAILWPSEIVTLGVCSMPERRGQSGVLPLAGAGLWRVVSSTSGADPFVSVV
jgi:hypothetical protein